MASNILVTGANGDIGRSVVNQALAQGKRVFATVRNKAHCETFEPHNELSFILMHLDDADSIRSAYSQIDKRLAGQALDGVIHCAAIQSPACVEFMKPEHLEQTLRINTIGSLLVMQQAFSRLRISGGNLVIASSIWGFVTGPALCPYAASKWALEALIRSAQCETKGMGFHICAANIGAVQSRMLHAHVDSIDQMLADGDAEMHELYEACFQRHAAMVRKFNSLATSADNVGLKLLGIIDRSKPSRNYTIGIDAHVMRFLNWLLPRSALDKVLSG
ncbi:MAG: SDR family NAD(P)-dependent oxidoreductase [Lacipirellulaceae bacterium]|uniref:SDR family NAD(P)-dependent oxidoreductase n=1 Tax=Marinobacter salarius TaxID=1420917 RepID=UPI0032EBD484